MTNRVGGKTLPSSELHFKLDSTVAQEVRLRVDMGTGLGGDQWPAAMCFCRIISENTAFYGGKVFTRETSVLELGSGTGLGGIAVAKLYSPTRIVISDLQQYEELINHNIDLNGVSSQCTAQVLDWCDLAPYHASAAATYGKSQFDIILALECVYREDLYDALLQTLLECSHEKTVIFLGLTRLFAKSVFFSFLSQKGFEYKKIPHGAMPQEWLRTDSSAADTAIFICWRTDREIEE